jgi:hypothetical protein
MRGTRNEENEEREEREEGEEGEEGEARKKGTYQTISVSTFLAPRTPKIQQSCHV